MRATVADVRGLMTIVVVLLIGAVQATNHPRVVKQSAGNTIKVLNEKGPRCHHPTTHNCNTSVYPILDWELSSWFYHSVFKACRPLYSAKGVHVCTENQDLPKTREICEDLCGEPCLMSNGSTGICMFKEMCKIMNNNPTANPRPCGSYGVNCCPKVSESSLIPYGDNSKDSHLFGQIGNRINAADQPSESSKKSTLYVYSFPRERLTETKPNK